MSEKDIARILHAITSDDRPEALDNYSPEGRQKDMLEAAQKLADRGLHIFTKQQAIDYVLNLPVEALGETETWPMAPNTAGKRLREMQQAMIENPELLGGDAKPAPTEEVEQDGWVTVHPKPTERCHGE